MWNWAHRLPRDFDKQLVDYVTRSGACVDGGMSMVDGSRCFDLNKTRYSEKG
jgi:hypothetical protein